MKQIKWGLTTLAFFIAAIGFASDFPKMNVTQVDANTISVVFECTKATPLEISVTNYSGEILYFKKTEKRFNKYQKTFDISEIGKGTFNICLNYGNKSINRDITVSKTKIIVGSPETLYEPYFSMKNGKLNVSFMNMACKNVYLNIYKNGEYLSGAKLGKEMAIQKCVDLSNLGEGSFEVILTDKFKAHRFNVQI